MTMGLVVLMIVLAIPGCPPSIVEEPLRHLTMPLLHHAVPVISVSYPLEAAQAKSHRGKAK